MSHALLALHNTNTNTRACTRGTTTVGGLCWRFRFDRIESQIRLLADSAFLMRDYDTAISMYRMARDDFKSDRWVEGSKEGRGTSAPINVCVEACRFAEAHLFPHL